MPIGKNSNGDWVGPNGLIKETLIPAASELIDIQQDDDAELVEVFTQEALRKIGEFINRNRAALSHGRTMTFHWCDHLDMKSSWSIMIRSLDKIVETVVQRGYAVKVDPRSKALFISIAPQVLGQ